MSVAAYILAIFSIVISIDNYQSIKEIRNHYNKLYKNSVYGKSVMEDFNEQ